MTGTIEGAGADSSVAVSSTHEGVFVPCDPNNVGEFFLNLLGKPQKLEKFVFGHFIINENHIVNFHHLIDQRIKQQNESHFISVSFHVLYDDDSSESYHSVDNFKSRIEIENKRSVGIRIEWVYLIKFIGRNVAEKQTIEIGVAANNETATISREIEGVVMFRRLPRLKIGHIYIKVNHTEKTWGHDIESMLIKNAKKLIIPDNRISEFVNKYSGAIGIVTSFVIFGSSVASSIISTNKLIKQLQNHVYEISRIKSQTVLLQQKMDFVMDITVKGVWHQHYNENAIFMGLMFIIAIIVGIWASETADNRPQSYLLLTSESVRFQERSETKYKQKWASFAVAMLLGLFTSILGSFMYEHYFK